MARTNIVIAFVTFGTVAFFNITVISCTKTWEPCAGCLKNINESSYGNAKTPLYIGGMISVTGNWAGSGCVLAAELALEQINNRSDILPDYELKLVWNDTQCTSSLPPRALYHQIVNEPTKLLLLGPSCSPGASIVAAAAQYWNLLTVLSSAVSPALADRTLYPKLYRTVQMGTSTYNGPALWFMKHFGWRRVASVADTSENSVAAQNDFVQRVFAMNATVVSETVSLIAKNQIENIKNLDMKIIFSFTNEDKARIIFCQAYRSGLYGAGMFWMIPGWYQTKWWLARNEDIECTSDQMSEVVELSLPVTVDVEVISRLNKTTVAGITPAEFVGELRKRLKWSQYKTYTLNNYISYTYDAVWAVALMLNRSATILSGTNSRKRLEDFSYTSNGLSQLFLNGMAATEFFGASGHVSFTRGERVGGTVLTQLQGHCEKGWYLNLRYCYKLRYNDTVDWTQAVEACGRDGSYLADVMTVEEIAFIRELWVSSASHTATKVNVGLHFIDQVLGNMTHRTLIDLHNRTSKWIMSDAHGDNESHDCIQVDFQEESSLIRGDCREKLPFICKKKGNFTFIPIGNHDTLTDTMVWTGQIDWPGGKIPDDQSRYHQRTIERIQRSLPGYLHILLSSLAVFGMALVVLILIFMIRLSNNRTFCDTIQILNFGILIGCFLLYLSQILTRSQFLLSLSMGDHVLICQVHKITTSVSATLGISSLVGKIWILYEESKIFSTTSEEVKRTRMAYFIVTVSIVADVICMTFWNIYYPTVLRTISVEKQVSPGDPLQVVEFYSMVCSTDDSGIIPVFLTLTDKVILLLMGALLSYGVRQTNVASLQERRQMSITIYNVIIFGSCGLILNHLLKSDPITPLVFTSVLVESCTSVTLLIVFLPKIISVTKFQREAYSTNKTTVGVSQVTNIMSDTMNTSTEVLSLRYRDKVPKNILEENTRLKKQLSQLMEKAEVVLRTEPAS